MWKYQPSEVLRLRGIFSRNVTINKLAGEHAIQLALYCGEMVNPIMTLVVPGCDPSDHDWIDLFHHSIEVLMRKRNDHRTESSSGPAPLVDGWIADLPLLAEHLTAVTWEDGSHRETSTLTVSWGLGHWRLSLRDRAMKLVLWVSGTSLEDALVSLEMAIDDPETVWRVDSYATGGPASRRKK